MHVGAATDRLTAHSMYEALNMRYSVHRYIYILHMALQDEWWLLGGVRTSFVKSCVNADSLADVRGIAMECDWPVSE